jgi:hypothetical protein
MMKIMIIIEDFSQGNYATYFGTYNQAIISPLKISGVGERKRGIPLLFTNGFRETLSSSFLQARHQPRIIVANSGCVYQY